MQRPPRPCTLPLQAPFSETSTQILTEINRTTTPVAADKNHSPAGWSHALVVLYQFFQKFSHRKATSDASSSASMQQADTESIPPTP